VKSAKAKSKRCFIWYQYKTWYFATKMMGIVNELKKKQKPWKCRTKVEMEVNMVTKQVAKDGTNPIVLKVILSTINRRKMVKQEKEHKIFHQVKCK